MGDGWQYETSSGALTPHPGSLVGPDNGEKTPWVNLPSSSPHKTPARAGRSRAKRRRASLADTAHAESSQSIAGQLEADTTSEITTAARLWWNSVTTGRRTQLTLGARVGTAQHCTRSKGRHSTTIMYVMYARVQTLPH